MDWIQLAQDRCEWTALMKALLNIDFHKRLGISQLRKYKLPKKDPVENINKIKEKQITLRSETNLSTIAILHEWVAILTVTCPVPSSTFGTQ